MKTNYQYPLESDWTSAEIVAVTDFFRAVEDAYEQPQGVSVAQLMEAYDGFKTVVPGKAQEKQLGRQFEAVSGYSLYRTLQAAKNANKSRISMADGGGKWTN